MKIKLEQLVNSKNALLTLSSAPLPIKDSYKVSKILEQFNQEAITYDGLMSKLLKKYAEPEGEGTYRFKTSEQKDLYEVEIAKLNGITVEIKSDKLPVSALEDVKMAPIQLLSLDWLIQYENDTTRGK